MQTRTQLIHRVFRIRDLPTRFSPQFFQQRYAATIAANSRESPRQHRDRRSDVEACGAPIRSGPPTYRCSDGGGDIVNISSVAGRTARAGNAAYAATKWGINGWSEALRQDRRTQAEPLSCISWQYECPKRSFRLPGAGQCDNLGAGEVTVLDLEDTEGPMRLASVVGG
jgi:hypothetical protein